MDRPLTLTNRPVYDGPRYEDISEDTPDWNALFPDEDDKPPGMFRTDLPYLLALFGWELPATNT